MDLSVNKRDKGSATLKRFAKQNPNPMINVIYLLQIKSAPFTRNQSWPRYTARCPHRFHSHRCSTVGPLPFHFLTRVLLLSLKTFMLSRGPVTLSSPFTCEIKWSSFALNLRRKFGFALHQPLMRKGNNALSTYVTTKQIFNI